MRRGPKPKLPSDHKSAGTFRRDRHGRFVEPPPAGPLQLSPPDWLTEGGREVWAQDAPRATAVKLADEADSSMFGNYANLVASMIAIWNAGGVPPAAQLTEARRMAEQFGLGAARSRLFAGRRPH